ncbi:hypothetical protein [Cribrihabitans pelagius]|uniref:hypothetical protein n=1 Tax=Cribrihabitans pelagius TaxID=1765746 RepID=UPI003B5A0A36
MKRIFFLAVAFAPQVSAAAETSVCVENGSEESHFFVAEAADGSREAAILAPGEQLCAAGGARGARGVVSVFESAQHLEGCSRLTPMGQRERLVRYADFDRCEWRGHSR